MAIDSPPADAHVRDGGDYGYPRQYGRSDVDYETWYSPWSKDLARQNSRTSLLRMLGIVSGGLLLATKTHHAAVAEATSMTSKSQRRAQARNVVALACDHKMAITGALEIHDLFPEHALMEVATPVREGRIAPGTESAGRTARTGSADDGIVLPEGERG